MKKRTWWSLSLRKWMNKMTSILPMLSCTRFPKSMKNYIGWPPRSWEMKPIKPLEFCGLRTTSLLKEQRSLKQNCSNLEHNWRGLLVQSSMRGLAFINLLLIELVWGMISLLLILPLLVLFCLSHLLII